MGKNSQSDMQSSRFGTVKVGGLWRKGYNSENRTSKIVLAARPRIMPAQAAEAPISAHLVWLSNSIISFSVRPGSSFNPTHFKNFLMTNLSTLQQLWATIMSRKETLPADSYTTHLFNKGENEILKKIGEESVEVIIAAKGEGDDRIIYESADLIYHLMVLLAARDLSWEQVEAELASRF